MNRVDPTGLTDESILQDDDSPLLRAVSESFDIGGFYTVLGHGSRMRPGQYYATHDGSSRVYTPQIVQNIRARAPEGQAILLMICHFGNSGSPQRVAQQTGRSVWAANTSVRFSRSGNQVSINPDGEYSATSRPRRDVGSEDSHQLGGANGGYGSFQEFNANGRTGRSIENIQWNTETNAVEFDIVTKATTGSRIDRREHVSTRSK